MKRQKRYKRMCNRCRGDGCKSCQVGKTNLIKRQILSSLEKLVEYSEGK